MTPGLEEEYVVRARENTEVETWRPSGQPGAECLAWEGDKGLEFSE